jgi:hypothetical protein
MEKIICDDNKLEEVIRNYVSTNFIGFKTLTLLIDDLWSFDIYDKKLPFKYTVELTKEDQLRINKILCKMITSGQLIINLVGKRDYPNDIEVAWIGE